MLTSYFQKSLAITIDAAVPAVRHDVANTDTAVSGVQNEVVNTPAIVSGSRHNTPKSPDNMRGQNLMVSTLCILPLVE